MDTVQCRLPKILFSYFGRIKKVKIIRLMLMPCVVIYYFAVNQKACIPHCQQLPNLKTSTVAMVKHMPHQRVFGKTCMIKV